MLQTTILGRAFRNRMPKFSLKSFVATTIWSAIGLLIIGAMFLCLISFLFPDYSLLTTKASPDGKMTISEFQSRTDGFGHAPYGTYLVLSREKKIKHPDDGYIFFAGYCSEIYFDWRSNDTIFIRCISKSKETNISTLATLMYGIKVEFDTQ